MNIVIDKQNITYTLEDEKTASDIILALRDWLRSGERVITDVDINTKKDAHDKRSWNDILIDDVKELQIETLHNIEFGFSSVKWLQDYIEVLQNALKNDDERVLKNLKEQEGEVRELLSFVLSNNGSNIIANKLEVRANVSKENDVFLNNLKELLSELEREFTQPLQECMLTAGLIMKDLETFKDIPILVQTGKGNDAMQLLIRFSDLSAKFLRIHPCLTFTYEKKDTDEVKEGIKEINTMLNSLARTLEEKDMVSAGDILEYELIPQMERWIKQFYHEYNSIEC